MRAVEIIRKKRDGQALSDDDIQAFVQGVTARIWPDYQASALLMAIWLRGMNAEETAALTKAMVHSGRKLDLSDLPGPKVDKHSTGGVGDKTTLILGPIVAACGVPCPMFSGRGLGHTGGTVDKFAAIPGLKVELTDAEFIQSLQETRFANSAPTGKIAPADKKLYALRDTTATVESIPLITASIMSKKLAGGADALVLSCPLCEFNLGKKQGELLSQGKASKPVPTFYFTQLLAVALGLSSDACRFELNEAASLELLKAKNFPV